MIAFQCLLSGDIFDTILLTKETNFIHIKRTEMQNKKKTITVTLAALMLTALPGMVSLAAQWKQNDSGVWYYIDEVTGEPLTDFQQDNGKWYFLSTAEDASKGAMLTGVQWIGHKCYFLNPEDGGAVAVNMDYDGYHFGSDGCAVNEINNPYLMEEGCYPSRIGVHDKLMAQEEQAVPGTAVSDTDDSENPYSRNQPAGYREEAVLEFLDILNAARAEKGRAELEIDEELMEAARIRAKEQVQCYGHERPDGSAWDTVFDELGIDRDKKLGGENANLFHYDPQKVYTSWYNSDRHRKNMMDSRYKKTGIACYFDPDSNDKYWWVQIFSN